MSDKTLVEQRKAIYDWARGDAKLLSARCAKAEESLAVLRSAWNAHMATCPQHAALPDLTAPTEDELREWRNAPSNTASADPYACTCGPKTNGWNPSCPKHFIRR